METLIISLLTSFATSFVSQAGSRTASLVFDQFGKAADFSTPAAVASRVKSDPRFAKETVDAINADILHFPAQAERIIETKPGLLQSILNISPEQSTFQRTGRCPVGREFLFRPPTYLKPDGTAVSPWTTFPALRRQSPLMRGQWKQGHQWLVFPVSAR
jgi:hypothetical protein